MAASTNDHKHYFLRNGFHSALRCIETTTASPHESGVMEISHALTSVACENIPLGNKQAESCGKAVGMVVL
jgi:hypothetical protein